MNYKKNVIRGAFWGILFLFLCGNAKAQIMPIVYDRTYGNDMVYQHTCPISQGEVALVGNNDRQTIVTWVKRDGEILFSQALSHRFAVVNNVYHIGDRKLLIIGQSQNWSSRKTEKNTCGRAVIVDNTGTVLNDVYAGDNGSEFFCGGQLKDGNLILGGYELSAAGSHLGMLTKIDKTGRSIYKYVSEESGPCIGFEVLGSMIEYVHAAFTSSENTASSVISLDSKGRVAFITKFTDEGFSINKMLTTQDDFLFLIGKSHAGDGRVIKIRPEGDIVFNKEIVPPSSNTMIDHLFLTNDGNLLVGGNGGDGKSYYSLLRNDGTELQKYVVSGYISGMGINPVTGESVIASFDNERSRGTITGLAKDGRQIYQKSSDGNFNEIHVTSNGIYLAESHTGRLCMLSPTGELLFDRYATDGGKTNFDEVLFVPNGDILFKGGKNRLVKMSHGLYVSDVKVNKPIDGYITALFSVTLTGFPTSEEGAPMPVRVEYFTKDGTANQSENYSPVKGSLSFIPASDGAGRYMIKQDVEVPIKTNNLFEGQKIFELNLANVEHSYLVKRVGTGTIEDQEVLVKHINTQNGLEGQRDIVYELGIFKTNGEKLINATGSDIIIEGYYGKGTADKLDYDMGIAPRLVVEKGASSGTFKVNTLVDTRFELPKTVVVDFNKILTINDATIGFEGSVLSCKGSIIDQPATVGITALGDHGRMNNIVSGFFKLSLLRASDGQPLINVTGGDIGIACSILPQTTAAEGKDFVLTNMHNLRILGDGNRSAVNLDGIVLFNRESEGSKKIVIGVDSITKPGNAPDIIVAPQMASAEFSIIE
ncbi:Calx-beta domain-containing protein [Proteiniphilum sp. X52]|uniref:Calx-beta domain-containing protein n=1 Tax=Proteiniphilum sp. X52 TaxID=2382159 RepID=UPI000F0A3B9A|nr:Calx-beta domain-containing protein [Proteiniphilum sp. X52]RNC65915.1 hypothetical protein D7D25_05195 [Proteiniphilum sp. X52]